MNKRRNTLILNFKGIQEADLKTSQHTRTSFIEDKYSACIKNKILCESKS